MTMPATLFVFVIWALIGFTAVAGSVGCGKRPLRIEDRIALAREKPRGPQQAAELLKVARRQLTANDRVGAHDTITAAFDQVSAGGEEAITTLLDVAQSYIDVDDRRTARIVLNRAVEIGKATSDPAQKARRLADAGALFGNADTGMADPQRARALLGEATTVAEGVEDRFRAEALAVVAMGYVSGGMAEEAGGMVEKLEACLAALSDPRAKAEALAAASSVYAKTGDEEKAKALLGDAASTAKGIGSPESKAYALIAVAHATATNGDAAAARALLDEADVAANQVGDPDSQANAVRQVRTALDRLK
jgi:tetratricopeptide (TPR) repeat protein